MLDSGRYVAGPWSATYLGEFGAEVVHLEGPPFGPPYADPTRTLPPLLPEGVPEESTISESWVQYSRNKLSVGVDLRQSEGRTLFLDLAERSDIWVESSRPGTYDRLDLSDTTVWERNPKLTIVHISGYGQHGVPERVGAPSFDLTGQAYSGYLSLQGNPDPDPPMRAGTALNDTVTGLAAAAAALMGYVSARRTGRGQAVDVAQYEVFFTLLENLALDYFARGVVRGRFGSGHARLHPYEVFGARDGWVVVAAPTEDSWSKLRELLTDPDPSWEQPAVRRRDRTAVNAKIAELCLSHTTEELEGLGRSHDLAISKVYDIGMIAHDAHYRAREMFSEWTDPVAGPVKGAGISPKFGTTPGRVWRGAPWLGQDNERVLRELLNYPEARIAELKAGGIIGEFRPRVAESARPPFFLRESL